MMDRKLVKNFRINEVEAWMEMESIVMIGFDNFYDELFKWALDQRELTYEDFAAAEI